jgi:hypothetical protein
MNWKLIAPSLAFILGACTSMQGPAPAANLPDKLKPGASESVALITSAKGVQIYECRAVKDRAGAYEWALVAPEADLFDAKGIKIGKHYAGPHWESTDGSKVVGTVKERVDAPQADAIPWLLLTARSDGPNGSFSKFTAVQRLNTVGGMAPTAGCSRSALGATARVPYTADYYFLAAR